MNNHNKFDLADAAKYFCQQVTIAASNDAFYLVMDAGGEDKFTFVFTPEHLKQLHQSIGYNVEQFEKNVRSIDAKWTPGIESPFNPKKK